MADVAPHRPIAVVPAAGRSRRMGRPKLLLPFGETTVLGATVSALERGGAAAWVVRTPEDRALALWAVEHAVHSVVNPAPERGMLSSVQAGIAAAAVALDEQPLLVCPGDLPCLRATSVEAVLAAQRRSAAPLAVPVWQGRQGHPLVIASQLLPEIETLDPKVGLRQLPARHAADLLRVPVEDPGVVRDVDTPADYSKIARRTLEPDP